MSKFLTKKQPVIQVELDSKKNIIITDETGVKKTVFANQLYDVDPIDAEGSVSTTDLREIGLVTRHNQIIRILDILKDAHYSRDSIQTAFNEPNTTKEESTKFDGVYDKYPDYLSNPKDIMHKLELAVTYHFLDSINPIDWLKTTDTTDIPEGTPLSPPSPTRGEVVEFIDAAKSISDIMIVDKRCFNFATEVVDPATRAPFVRGRDFFFPAPGTEIYISQQMLEYLGLKNCSVRAKRTSEEWSKTGLYYDFEIKVGSFTITKDTAALYGMNIFAGNTVKNILLKTPFNVFFEANREKFDEYIIPDGINKGSKLKNVRLKKSEKDFKNEYRRAYFAIKQAIIIAKEMGDLFQVLFMLIWSILNPDDDYSMATPDFVVFITCLLYQVNCVLTGIKCPFYSHFLKSKGVYIREYISQKLSSTKSSPHDKDEEDEEGEEGEEGETHIYCELEFKKGVKIDINVVMGKILEKNSERIESCKRIRSLGDNYSIRPQELDNRRTLTRDPRIYTGGFMKVLIRDDENSETIVHVVRIIVLPPKKSSKRNYRLVFADLTESDATAVEIDEFINNPILLVSNADKQKWIKETIKNLRKKVGSIENYTLSDLGMTEIRNSTLNLKEFITDKEYADETTKNKSTLPVGFFDTMITDIEEINKQLTVEADKLRTVEISHEHVYNLNRKFMVFDIFRCVPGFTDVFDMIPLTTYTAEGDFSYGFSSSTLPATQKSFYDIVIEQGLWKPLKLQETEDYGVTSVVGKQLAKNNLGDFAQEKTEQAAAQRSSSRNQGVRKVYTGMGGGDNHNSLNMITYNDTIKYWKYEERDINIKQDIFPIDNLIDFVDNIYETDENGLLTNFEKGLFNYDGSISNYGFYNPLAIIFNKIYNVLLQKNKVYYYNQTVSYFLNVFDINRQFMSIDEMNDVLYNFVYKLPEPISDLPPLPTSTIPSTQSPPLAPSYDEIADLLKGFTSSSSNQRSNVNWLSNIPLAQRPIRGGSNSKNRKTMKKHKHKKTIKKNKKIKRFQTIKHKNK